jgi:probable HAF family extracellular repeat protein
MKRADLFFLLIAGALIPAMVHAQPSYTLVDLNAGSPYDQTTANSINSAGHVTGYGVVASTGEIHAFILANGVFQDLGLMGYQASDGIALNDSDQLAADGIGPGSTALLYSNGHASQIGNIDGGYTSALGINDLGDIVGSAWNGDGGIVGFSWIGGTFTDLTPLAIYRARSINHSDQFVGSSIYTWGGGEYLYTSSHAFRVTGGVLTDLGSLTGNPQTNTEAYGINNSGAVVGYSTAADGRSHAFLYTSGPLQDLGTMYGDYSVAVAINNDGVIIGNLQNPYGAVLGSFVFAGGTMYDLSNLIVSNGDGWSQLVAVGLNDSGDIVGYGTLNGGTHGFIARPMPSAGVTPGNADLALAIENARPNPYRSSTEIGFRLPATSAEGDVRLRILDVAGRQIAEPLHGHLSPGVHTVIWSGRSDDGSEAPGGTYFIRLTTRQGTVGGKAVLIR